MSHWHTLFFNSYSKKAFWNLLITSFLSPPSSAWDLATPEFPTLPFACSVTQHDSHLSLLAELLASIFSPTLCPFHTSLLSSSLSLQSVLTTRTSSLRAFFSCYLWIFAWLCSWSSHPYIMARDSVLFSCHGEAPLTLSHTQCLSYFLATLTDHYELCLLEFTLDSLLPLIVLIQTILLNICHKTFRNIISTNTIPICFIPVTYLYINVFWLYLYLKFN